MSIIIVCGGAAILSILFETLEDIITYITSTHRSVKKRMGRHYTFKKAFKYELITMFRHLITPK